MLKDEPPHGEIQIACDGRTVIDVDGASHTLRGYWPGIKLTDTDGSDLAELVGEADKARVAPFHYRAMIVEPFAPGDGWTPNGISDVPPHGTIRPVLHPGTEVFEEAAHRCERFNAAQLGPNGDNEVRRWAVVVPPDTAVEIGEIGRRRPATFSAQSFLTPRSGSWRVGPGRVLTAAPPRQDDGEHHQKRNRDRVLIHEEDAERKSEHFQSTPWRISGTS